MNRRFVGASRVWLVTRVAFTRVYVAFRCARRQRKRQHTPTIQPTNNGNCKSNDTTAHQEAEAPAAAADRPPPGPESQIAARARASPASQSDIVTEQLCVCVAVCALCRGGRPPSATRDAMGPASENDIATTPHQRARCAGTL